MRPLPNRRLDDSIGLLPPLTGPHTGCFALPKRVVLIGHPVTQSLSGALQQAAFDELGIDARYEPLDVPLIELPETIDALRGDDFLGANITVPYKERVVPMVDRLTEEAQATGAVDTITREGSAADRPQHRRDRLPRRARRARSASRRCPRRGDHRRRRRRARGGLHADHRRLPARDRLQPPPPSSRGAGPPLRPHRVAHGAARDALARVGHRGRAGQDEGAHQRLRACPMPDDDIARPRRAAGAGAAGAGPDVRAARDASCCATRGRPARPRR